MLEVNNIPHYWASTEPLQYGEDRLIYTFDVSGAYGGGAFVTAWPIHFLNHKDELWLQQTGSAVSYSKDGKYYHRQVYLKNTGGNPIYSCLLVLTTMK